MRAGTLRVAGTSQSWRATSWRGTGLVRSMYDGLPNEMRHAKDEVTHASRASSHFTLARTGWPAHRTESSWPADFYASFTGGGFQPARGYDGWQAGGGVGANWYLRNPLVDDGSPLSMQAFLQRLDRLSFDVSAVGTYSTGTYPPWLPASYNRRGRACARALSRPSYLALGRSLGNRRRPMRRAMLRGAQLGCDSNHTQRGNAIALRTGTETQLGNEACNDPSSHFGVCPWGLQRQTG